MVPVLPKDGTVANSNSAASEDQVAEKPSDESQTATGAPEQPDEESKPAAPVAVNSWSALFKRSGASKPASAGPPPLNGTAASDKPVPATDGATVVAKSTSTSLADVLKTYEVRSNDKIYFIEPRALKNRGTDCYMNSVSLNQPRTIIIDIACQVLYSHDTAIGPASTCLLHAIL